MKTFHFNIIILSEKLYRWRNNLSLRMGLNITVHPLMNISTSCKVVFSLDQIFRERNFHHLEMNSYLHQKNPWLIALLFIHLNRRISVIMIIYVSCQVVWYSMTSSWIYERTRDCIPKLWRWLFFTKIENNNIYMYRGSLQDFYWKKAHTSV